LDGIYTIFETTADKTVDSSTVTDLSPDTIYYFRVRAVTNPHEDVANNAHANNQNTVYSEYTDVVSADTLPSQLLSVYVSTTGSDETGDGSESKPFVTIQAAIDMADEGDSVIVGPGTYIENLSFYGKSITVQSSAGAEHTIIDGNQNGSVVKLESDANLTVVLVPHRNGHDWSVRQRPARFLKPRRSNRSESLW